MRDQQRDPCGLTSVTCGFGEPLEQRVLGLSVKCSGRFVEHEQQRLRPHSGPSEGESLPLPT